MLGKSPRPAARRLSAMQDLVGTLTAIDKNCMAGAQEVPREKIPGSTELYSGVDGEIRLIFPFQGLYPLLDNAFLIFFVLGFVQGFEQ